MAELRETTRARERTIFASEEEVADGPDEREMIRLASDVLAEAAFRGLPGAKVCSQ